MTSIGSATGVLAVICFLLVCCFGEGVGGGGARFFGVDAGFGEVGRAGWWPSASPGWCRLVAGSLVDGVGAAVELFAALALLALLISAAWPGLVCRSVFHLSA